MAISFRAGTPEEAIRFVDGIIRSYEQFLEEKSKDGNHQVIALVSKARDELGRQLGQLEAKYLEFQQSHPHLLELVNDGAGHPILGSRLQELERAANESALKALKLKSQLDLGRKLAEQGPELWSIAFAIAQLGGDPGAAPVAPSPGAALASSSDYVRQLIKEQQELVARHGAGFSKVRELQDLINEAEQAPTTRRSTSTAARSASCSPRSSSAWRRSRNCAPRSAASTRRKWNGPRSSSPTSLAGASCAAAWSGRRRSWPASSIS